MGRKASREIAMKLLYQLEIQRGDREEQIETAFLENAVSKEDKRYILDVVKGVFQNLSLIDSLIENNAKGWKLHRISKVDLSILRLGIYEMIFRKDIPVSVSVNEAVELAKKYSGEDAGSFVNGILGKVDKSVNSRELNR